MPSDFYRGPLPTLTEDDLRDQGERVTVPPPMPMGDLVRCMMDEAGAPPDLELRELGQAEAAAIVVEVSEAYVAELGSRAGVPVLLKTAAELCKMPLDHLSGFLLSLVDGTTTVQDILDLSSLPEVDALEQLCQLRELGLIDVRRRRP